MIRILSVSAPSNINLEDVRMFAAHRLRGEWFADVPEIRAYFGVAS